MWKGLQIWGPRGELLGRGAWPVPALKLPNPSLSRPHPTVPILTLWCWGHGTQVHRLPLLQGLQDRTKSLSRKSRCEHKAREHLH